MLIEPREAPPGALTRWSRPGTAPDCPWRQRLAGVRPPVCASRSLRGNACRWSAASWHSWASSAVSSSLPVWIRPTMRPLRTCWPRCVTTAVACWPSPASSPWLGALIWSLFLARPDVSWWNVLYSERNIVTALSENWLVALRQMFVYAAYALGLLFFGLNIPGLTSFLQFPCATLLGLPFRAAYQAGAAAQMKNLPACSEWDCCSFCCR